MKIKYPPRALPILKECDLVVQDGSFAGISAALKAARQGKGVVLVEPRTYLGWEMTVCLRPWMDLKEIEARDELPEVIQTILTPNCCKTIGNEVVFNLDRVKIALEDCVLNAGIVILYASRVIDRLEVDGKIQGVMIGNKSCRQVIRCPAYAEPSCEGLRFDVGREGDNWQYPEPFIWRTLEFTGVDLSGVGRLPLPEFLGAGPGDFRIHPGGFDELHWFVEFPVAVNRFHGIDGGLQGHEFEIQKLTYQTAQTLIQQVDAFRGAYWAGSSYESYPWSHSLLEHLGKIDLKIHPDSWMGINRENDETAINVSEMNAFSHSEKAMLDVPGLDIAITDRVDILVVGGGTSGAIAALTAAENGMNTFLVEMNPRLGGTGTIGGVHSYWYGREAGFTTRFRETVEAIHREIEQPVPVGDIPRWNIEARAWALLKLAHERRINVVFNWRAIGTVVDQGVVRGVVFSTPVGLRAIEARVVIDATGDGDLAAFSGAPFTYGSERSRATMWYSLAQYAAPGKTSNNFTSMVDIGNVEDYTRAILTGRRRGENCVEHGAYLATRESRQILGEARVTLTDQLRQKRHPDVIHIAFSNYDVKGHTDSDWLRTGLIPPNLEVEIPLGALIPQGLENLLVVGKAISATHDALPSIRMQRDLENLGGTAGVVAAAAVEWDCPLREVPVVMVQKRLVQAGALPPDVLDRSCKPMIPEVENLLTRLDANTPLYAYSDMEMHEIYRGVIPFVELCCAGKEALPRIRRELQSADGPRRRLLAQALAMMGDASGVEDLLDAIEEQLAAGFLPARSASIRNTQLPPDQGAMPDVVYWLYSLGMLGDERAVATWERVADALRRTSPEDFYSQTKGTFYYIDAVCYGAERLGSERCVAVLRQLKQIPHLCNRVSQDLIQVDFVLERMAFLELAIARALLCCGAADGIPVLINYLDDVRATLREHAYALLVRFTGMDIKMDSAAWMDWYQGAKLELIPTRDTTLTDAQKAW